MTTLQFQPGKTYSTRAICDHNCIFSFKIIRRTSKSVWITGSGVKNERRKIELWDGKESIYPLGKYSMAPIIRADD